MQTPILPARKVSVITRTKDRPLFLQRARQSIASQTYTDFVWVVVNDGGQKSEVESEVAKARRSGIDTVLTHNETSRDRWPAARQGVAAADADYVILHDDDDAWKPTFLERTVSALNLHPEWSGVITHCDRVAERLENGALNTLYVEPFFFTPEAMFLSHLLVRNLFPPIVFLYRRSMYDEIGGYDESFQVMGDWDFNLRALMRGDIGVIPEALALLCHREKSEALGPAANVVRSGDNRYARQQAAYRNACLRDAVKTGLVHMGLLLSLPHLAGHYGAHPVTPARKARRLLSRIKMLVGVQKDPLVNFPNQHLTRLE